MRPLEVVYDAEPPTPPPAAAAAEEDDDEEEEAAAEVAGGRMLLFVEGGFVIGAGRGALDEDDADGADGVAATVVAVAGARCFSLKTGARLPDVSMSCCRFGCIRKGGAAGACAATAAVAAGMAGRRGGSIL